MIKSRIYAHLRSSLLPLGLLLALNTADASGDSAGVAHRQEAGSKSQDARSAVTRHLDMAFSMPEYRSREEWLARRDSLRQQILVSAGLWPSPDKSPLKSQIFGRLDRDGYSIEKVYFQSYPGFFVTGNLYRPLGKKGPHPGVLSPHGHWTYGRLENSALASVPARCVTMARQGYVVFSYDMVGYNDSRQVNHRFQGEREALWGFGSLGLHLWNSIRAVDFLESLPDVDKSRLACTGASGGGTQTFLLAAVDDRISVSAPVNMISAHMQGGDVCENAPNLRIDTNNMEIAALMAPRPMIMVSASGDWTKNTLTVEFPAIQKIYRFLAAEEKLTAVQVNAEHNYNRQSREHVYRWFGKWLLGDQRPESLAEKGPSIDPVSEMLVFYGRSLPPEMKNEREIVEDYIRAAAARIDSMKPKDQSSWESYRAAFGPALKYSVMAEQPSPGEVQATEIQTAESADFRATHLLLGRKGKGDRLPATLWAPPGKTAAQQTVLLMHPLGAQGVEAQGSPSTLIRALLGHGSSVLVPDLFNTGRAAFERLEKKNFFTTYNRTDAANRVQDILTSLAYLRAQSGGQMTRVVGLETTGPLCLVARAFAGTDTPFAVDMARLNAAEDESFLKSLNIPLIRRAGDFKTAAVLNVQSPLWIYNASESFPSDWVRSVYGSLSKSSLLRIESDRAEESSLLNWLLEGVQH